MALIAENALPLALIANELLSNALKHAFSNGSSGNITVTLRHASPTAEGAPVSSAD
jgi:two-component sensor histidine kinase